MHASANVVKAATGTDIINGGPPVAPDLLMLLRPNELLEPILSGPFQTFSEDIPITMAGLVVDPCGLLTGSNSQLLGGASIPVCDDIDVVTDFVLDLIDPLGILH